LFNSDFKEIIGVCKLRQTKGKIKAFEEKDRHYLGTPKGSTQIEAAALSTRDSLKTALEFLKENSYLPISSKCRAT